MNNKEVEEVIESKENILNNRFAGGGKSTFCRNILQKLNLEKCHYITFSKTMADEFKKELGNNNCQVSTIHSLAFKGLLKKGWNPAKLPFQDFPLNYTAFNKAFGLKPGSNDYNIVKEHYNLFLKTEEISKIYVNKIEDNNQKQYFLDIVDAVNKQKLPCSHDFYLKKYALLYEPLDTDLLIVDKHLFT